MQASRPGQPASTALQDAADIDVHKRRTLYRAKHRGTKELDILLGRYADAHVPGMAPREIAAFDELLAVADPTLQDWLLSGATVDEPPFVALVNTIRAFHGLT